MCEVSITQIYQLHYQTNLGNRSQLVSRDIIILELLTVYIELLETALCAVWILNLDLKLASTEILLHGKFNTIAPPSPVVIFFTECREKTVTSATVPEAFPL